MFGREIAIGITVREIELRDVADVRTQLADLLNLTLVAASEERFDHVTGTDFSARFKAERVEYFRHGLGCNVGRSPLGNKPLGNHSAEF